MSQVASQENARVSHVTILGNDLVRYWPAVPSSFQWRLVLWSLQGIKYLVVFTLNG